MTPFSNYFSHRSGCKVLWGAGMSVCLSVCLSVCEDISGTTCAIFTKFFVHVAYGCGSVFLRQGDKISRGMDNLRDFLSHWQSSVQRSILNPYKNGWTDRDAVWVDELAWPGGQCVTCGWWLRKGNGQFLGETCPTSLTPRWTVNWTGPCSGVHTVGQMLDCECWTSLLSAARGGAWECNTQT